MKRYLGKYITWKDFPKFAGKELWILVYSYENNRKEYIKINDIDADLRTMRYCCLGAAAVNDPIYEDNYSWFLDRMYLEREGFPEEFSVERPLEILTTDEIIEALHTDMLF